MATTLTQIENAFQPAREVDSAERFAGRRQAVLDSYYALLSEGTNLAVVGNRGIGKSSLARQITAIASGNNSLLERLDLAYDRRLDFLPIYFACGNTVKSIPDLLERLLTTADCLADWIYDVPIARKEIESVNPKVSAKVFGIGAEAGAQHLSESNSSPALKSHTIETVFANVCSAIVNERIATDGLLLAIDEFDQVRDPDGMAGLMKSFATNVPKVKFCLVGVARDVENLIREHESTDRLFAGGIVNLPPMPNEELSEIIRIAENSIDRSIRFSDDAIECLVRLARGHPYMVHLVGKYALRRASITTTQRISTNRR